MAKETLGDTIDIHAGGQDLTFPHHENEIAQSECHNHAPFSNYWMHNAFINIDNVKMSKSLGNFRLVKDIISEIDPMVLRLFMLTVHYRTPINYTLENIELAKTNFEKLKTSYQNLEFRLKPGTKRIFENIGVKNNHADKIDELYPDMKESFKGWKKYGYVQFKQEGKQITINLGNKRGLEIFNQNLKDYKFLKEINDK